MIATKTPYIVVRVHAHNNNDDDVGKILFF